LSSEELLDGVAREVVVCVKCRLWKSRKNAVPGAGNPEGRVLLIGEAPGQSEDIEGKPFVGAAGRLLDNLLSDIGLSRANVFITNVVKCRPPRNRDPQPNEIDTCTPYLNRQIAILQPKFIVTLGRHSTAYVFSKAGLPFQSITQTHGKIHETRLWGMDITIFPTFHPAATLYSAKYKGQLAIDFQKMRNELLKRGLVPSSVQ